MIRHGGSDLLLRSDLRAEECLEKSLKESGR